MYFIIQPTAVTSHILLLRFVFDVESEKLSLKSSKTHRGKFMLFQAKRRETRVKKIWNIFLCHFKYRIWCWRQSILLIHSVCYDIETQARGGVEKSAKQYATMTFRSQKRKRERSKPRNIKNQWHLNSKIKTQYVLFSAPNLLSFKVFSSIFYIFNPIIRAGCSCLGWHFDNDTWKR